jgi:endo-1,4-beta-mannosidase
MTNAAIAPGMISRRNFLRYVALSITGAIAAACGRVVETSAPSSQAAALAQPSSSPSPVASVTPTASVSPTVAPSAVPTLAPSPTSSPSLTPAVTPTAFPPDLIKVRDDQFTLRGERFPINGFNYYPRLHPWRTFNVGEWDSVGAERELRLAASLGANVVRIFVDYPYSLDTGASSPPDVYFALIPQYLSNLREFIDLSGRLNIRVIVTLFDSVDWSIYQPYNQWMAQEYLKQIIPPFVGDPRILCWDLQNEPDRAIVSVGPDVVISFFKRVSAQIRQMDPNHLQTIGWIDRARGKYLADLDRYLDFWCFHFYDVIERLSDLITFYKGKTTKPVLLQEFGLATGGPGADGRHTELDQSLHYSRVYALISGYDLCGSVFWTLMDFPQGLAGNPPSPDDSPENHFGVYRLDYSEKPVARAIRYAWTGR